MNTLSAIKWSCKVVQKNKTVSTDAVSLNENDSLYSISAENMVLMVLILSQKSTNMQSTELYTPVGQQHSSGPLVGGGMTCHSQLSHHSFF